MKWSRTFEALACQQQLYPLDKALISRNAGAWTVYSTQACQTELDRYSRMLWGLGVRKGDRVLMVPNLATHQWLFLDLAVQQLGAISVPCHVTNQAEQFQAILHETEATLCFFPTSASFQTFLPPSSQTSNLQIVLLEKDQPDSIGLEELLAKADQLSLDLEEVKSQVQDTDLACIIYTSGTSGQPKGVMLSHANIVSNIKAALSILPLQPGKKSLSFLPFSHIFERTTIYAYLASGTSLYLTEDRDHLLSAFRQVRPHYFTAVPRILERMYDQVLEFQAKQAWWMRRIIQWALKLGINYREHAKVRPMYWFQKQFARMLVFNRFRGISGGKVEAIYTGAAYLRPEIGRIFAAAGVKVREGYGMTETAPVITMNQFSPGLNRFGTVGIPIPGVEIRIDQPDESGEGEIIVRGPNVMQGYYKRPEETAEILSEEGWLRTGDVGKFVHRRFLKITDRKKDIFKTSSGKYIAPMALENHFMQSHYIEQIMVVGFQQAYVAALIRPNFELVHLWCLDEGIHWTSPQYMVHNIKVRQKIEDEIELLNQTLPNHEKLRDFHLFHDEWTVEGGHLTYTMKLIRNKIAEEFAKPIKEMFEK
ncbi:MAG: long-chain fatty acid--CoA ligase [Bacteroidota bacterium]